MAFELPATIPPRSGTDRVLGGVCAGIAEGLGLDPILVRIATIVLAISGPGVPLYAVAWLVMPDDGPLVAGERRARQPLESRRGVGLLLVVVGAVLLIRALGLTPPDQIVWPVLIVGIGTGVLYWQIQPTLEPSRWVAARILTGVVVVALGLVAFVAGNISITAVRDSVLALVLVVGGLSLLLGPWLVLLNRERVEDRQQRVKADARADVAAHLHDSVLQTFALMQRTDDPIEMATLARQQERELRRWLYAESEDPSAVTLKSAIERSAALVEDRHDVSVEVVVVGDAVITPATEALIAATREAATNSAKWSGCDVISLFVEVTDAEIEAFVRDTGIGFDPAEIAEDRLGVRESIMGRMERVGGSAEIDSALGEGTEIRLCVPTTPGTV